MSKDTEMPKNEPENQEEVKESTEAQTEKEEKKPKKEKKESKKDKKAEEIKELEEKLSAQKESYMRLAAEYDNYRKRTAKEKLSIYNDATAKAVEELFPVADSVQMALQSLKDASDEEKKGIELIAQQLDKSFERLKIEKFGEIGDEFNPELHNAISKIESEELGKNEISQVFQKGYKIGDKVIRSAMVQVANCD